MSRDKIPSKQLFDKLTKSEKQDREKMISLLALGILYLKVSLKEKVQLLVDVIGYSEYISLKEGNGVIHMLLSISCSLVPRLFLG